MLSIILPSPTESPTILKCRPARVYVRGRRRRNLEVVTWEVLPAPRFGRATLAVKPRPQDGLTKATADVAALPPVGARVLIRPAPRSGGGELRGIVTGHSINIGRDGDQLVAEVEHRLAGILEQTIGSRWQLLEDTPLEVECAKVRFNRDDKTLASASLVEVGTRQCRVFSPDDQGQHWSVADALAYLIATAVPGNVEAPDPEELEELAGRIELDPLDITGMTVAQALVRVARCGGLALRSSRIRLGLMFYCPGRHGRRRRVSLQPHGGELSLQDSNLLRGRVTFRRRPSRPGVLAMGQRKRYESTFQLHEGWETSLETYRWRDFVRSESDDWLTLANVYRKWVLNEHGRYSDSPWQIPRFSFSNISEEDFSAYGSRRFLPCLSTDESGQSLGIVVEYRYEPEADWKRWPGSVWVSDEEGTIYLGGDALPSDYFNAAANHEAEVCVTATVEADAHLTVEIPGDPNCVREVVDLSGRAAWRTVHETSIFHDLAAAGLAAERDDTQALEELARRYAEAASSATEAELVLGWINTSYHVGDIVTRIDGRNVELPANPYSRPFIQAVRHDFGREQTTTLTVSA